MSKKTQGDVIVDLQSRRGSHVEMPADCGPGDESETTQGPGPSIDCSIGDQRRVLISEDTALLFMRAFMDLANERRVTAMDLSGAEGINRAFREAERISKALVE